MNLTNRFPGHISPQDNKIIIIIIIIIPKTFGKQFKKYCSLKW